MTEKPTPQQIKSVKKRRKLKKLPIIMLVLLIVSIGFGSFYFIQYQKLNTKYKDLSMTDEEKNKNLVNKISKVYKVPTYDEEKPIVWLVKDKDKLSGAKSTQDFFKDAKTSDVVIAYQKANISIIYRESENKIIHTDDYNNFVAAANPVNLGIIANNANQQNVEKTLTDKIKNINIVSKTEPKSPVSQGVVVDVDGKNAESAKKLAELLGLQVGQLPAGEIAPATATLVIVLPS